MIDVIKKEVRVQDVYYQGKIVMYINFENCSPEKIFEVIAEAKKFIVNKPKGSVLTLTNCKDLHYTHENLQVFKEWITFNKPYVKAAAITGLKPILRIAYLFVIKATGRNIPEFHTHEEAFDWLVTQSGAPLKNLNTEVR